MEARIDDEDSSLTQIIVAGRKGAAVDRVRFELVKSDPMQIINEQIIPALGEVGNRYEKGTIFLPQLISSAETAKLAFVEINNEIARVAPVRNVALLSLLRLRAACMTSGKYREGGIRELWI